MLELFPKAGRFVPAGKDRGSTKRSKMISPVNEIQRAEAISNLGLRRFGGLVFHIPRKG